MNVDVLLLHLNNLSHLLRDAGTTKSATDLKDACALFSPFQGQKLETVLKDFEKAKQIIQNAAAPPRAAKVKIPPEEVAAITDRIVALHNRAGQPGLSDEEIDATFTAARFDSLSVAQLNALAARLNIPKLTGKPKIIDAIKKAVRDRKGAMLRVGI